MNQTNFEFVDNLILALDWYDSVDFVRKTHVLYQKDSIFFLLADNSTKFQEVSKMTTKLQFEFIKYNSKELNLEDLNQLISKLEWWCGFGNDETNSQMIDTEKYEEYVCYLINLRKIERELKINKLIN